MKWPRVRMHLAWCDYCGSRIAWSRRRRQWLALCPLMTPGLSSIQRRLNCTSAPKGVYHDPAVA